MMVYEGTTVIKCHQSHVLQVLLCTAGTAWYFRKYIVSRRVIPAIHHFKDGAKRPGMRSETLLLVQIFNYGEGGR